MIISRPNNTCFNSMSDKGNDKLLASVETNKYLCNIFKFQPIVFWSKYNKNYD